MESIGIGWRTIDEYTEKLKQVTPEQIQAVAKKYLVPDRLTTAELVPQSLDLNEGNAKSK